MSRPCKYGSGKTLPDVVYIIPAPNIWRLTEHRPSAMMIVEQECCRTPLRNPKTGSAVIDRSSYRGRQSPFEGPKGSDSRCTLLQRLSFFVQLTAPHTAAARCTYMWDRGYRDPRRERGAAER